jgi:membrane-bound ClpP family serine protease
MRAFAIIVTTLGAFGLGITGIVLMVTGTGSYVDHDVGVRSMIGGGVLITLGVFLLITAAIMAFISSWQKSKSG